MQCACVVGDCECATVESKVASCNAVTRNRESETPSGTSDIAVAGSQRRTSPPPLRAPFVHHPPPTHRHRTTQTHTEQSWVVDGEHVPPPDPDNGGDMQPPRRPDGCRPGLPTPAEKVWGRLGLQAMPTPASTEHSRASLRSPFSQDDESEMPSEEPNSPIVPRNLFGSGSEDRVSDGARASDEGSEDAEDVAPGAQAAISAEGYADDTYMLTMYLLSLLAMLAATSKWLKLTAQEVNATKSLAFTAAHLARKRPSMLEATLDGVRIPTQQEFRQLGVGVRTVPRRGTGPLLHKRIAEGKAALRKTRTTPGGFDRKATVAAAAVMIVAATLFGVELADMAQRDVYSLASAIMTAIWGPTGHAERKRWCLPYCCQGTKWLHPWSSRTGGCAGLRTLRAPRALPRPSRKPSGSKQRSPGVRPRWAAPCKN